MHRRNNSDLDTTPMPVDTAPGYAQALAQALLADHGPGLQATVSFPAFNVDNEETALFVMVTGGGFPYRFLPHGPNVMQKADGELVTRLAFERQDAAAQAAMVSRAITGLLDHYRPHHHALAPILASIAARDPDLAACMDVRVSWIGGPSADDGYMITMRHRDDAPIDSDDMTALHVEAGDTQVEARLRGKLVHLRNRALAQAA